LAGEQRWKGTAGLSALRSGRSDSSRFDHAAAGGFRFTVILSVQSHKLPHLHDLTPKKCIPVSSSKCSATFISSETPSLQQFKAYFWSGLSVRNDEDSRLSSSLNSAPFSPWPGLGAFSRSSNPDLPCSPDHSLNRH
jgi:hypothetical protein